MSHVATCTIIKMGCQEVVVLAFLEGGDDGVIS